MNTSQMNRGEALNLVKSKVKGKNLVKHMLAVEAIMRRLAQHLNEDEKMWCLTGLLHDLDYDENVLSIPQLMIIKVINQYIVYLLIRHMIF